MKARAARAETTKPIDCMPPATATTVALAALASSTLESAASTPISTISAAAEPATAEEHGCTVGNNNKTKPRTTAIQEGRQAAKQAAAAPAPALSTLASFPARLSERDGSQQDTEHRKNSAAAAERTFAAAATRDNPWAGKVGGGNHPNHPDLKGVAALPPAEPDKKNSDSPTAAIAPVVRVKAMVSMVEDVQDMLVRSVLLGDSVQVAHLDSCGTHCFMSEAKAIEMQARGYPIMQSTAAFDVHQGNPLCVSNRILVLPLSMVTEHGEMQTWEACLFIIAECGADIIIGYTTLRLGGIVKYEPPPNYEQLLQRHACQHPTKQESSQQASAIAARSASYQYSPPCATTERSSSAMGSDDDDDDKGTDENITAITRDDSHRHSRVYAAPVSLMEGCQFPDLFLKNLIFFRKRY